MAGKDILFRASHEEAEAITRLAEESGLPEEGVLRQALRLYQFHNRRLAAGETCSWSGDAARTQAFIGPDGADR